MRGSTSTMATALTVAALMTGCASSGQDQGSENQGPDRVTLTVDNQNWQDATVYLVGNGPRVRLGTVSTNGSDRFILPRNLSAHGTIRLAVDLIGSSSSTITDPIMVDSGSDVRWTIQNHLALSSYQVR